MMNKVGAVIIGGHFQGLGVLRSLARQGVPVCLLDHQQCIGAFSRYQKKYIRCPDISEQLSFFDFMMHLATRENLQGWVVYPNDDETVCFLSKYKSQLEQHYRIPTQSWDIVRLVYEKKLTYQLAEKASIPVPKTFYPDNVKQLEQLVLQFPAIIKPSVKEPFYSRTRKKAIRVDSKQELIAKFEWARSLVGGNGLMVQEFIPGGPRYLYSVGSLYKAGEFLGRVVARRPRQHPMDFGHATTYAETVDIPHLEKISKKILGLIGYYGLSEVEFMLDPRDGKYKLLEINARPWGWHTLAIAAGVDLPYLLYQDMLGREVKIDGFRKNVKWIRLVTDTPTAAGEILKGRLSIGSYLNSLLRGKKEFDVLSLSDPLPFIAELAMIPYLWKKRGF